MSTYRLPDALGGSEVEVLRGWAREDSRIDVRVPGAGIITLSPAMLVVVPTPLPEEPPVGAVVLDAYGHAWQHMDGESRGDWLCTNDDAGDDWQNLNEIYSPLRMLVPAPEPVELPWTQGPMVVDFDSYGLGGGPHKVAVKLRGEDAHITAIRAREMAAALITAADKAEGGGPCLS